MKKGFLLMACITAFALIGRAQSDSTLKEYAGRYIFPDGSVVSEVTVTIDGAQLSMSSSAGVSQLNKLGVDSFQIVEFQGTAVFKRGDSRAIKSVHIEAAGYVLDGTKEDVKGWAFRSYRKPTDAITVE